MRSLLRRDCVGVSEVPLSIGSSRADKKRATHSENFLGGLVCTRNLAFRLQ